ncbi:hypothetical protein JW905_02230 [bacterium]|nr:hypothetical protein [candidate division CSSED10-310 bacterium]
MGKRQSRRQFEKRMKKKTKKLQKMKKWEIAVLLGAFFIAFGYVIALGKLGLGAPSNLLPTPTAVETASTTPTPAAPGTGPS